MHFITSLKKGLGQVAKDVGTAGVGSQNNDQPQPDTKRLPLVLSKDMRAA